MISVRKRYHSLHSIPLYLSLGKQLFFRLSRAFRETVPAPSTPKYNSIRDLFAASHRILKKKWISCHDTSLARSLAYWNIQILPSLSLPKPRPQISVSQDIKPTTDHTHPDPAVPSAVAHQVHTPDYSSHSHYLHTEPDSPTSVNPVLDHL